MADLDGDGDLDVLSLRLSIGRGPRLAWYENTDGAGSFGPQQVITTAVNGTFGRCTQRTWTVTATWMCSRHLREDEHNCLVREHRRTGHFRTAAGDRPRMQQGPIRCTRRTWTATAIWMCSPHLRADDKIAWYENTDGAGNFGPQQVITTEADGARLGARSGPGR